jgi:hypothetical protein
MLSATLAESLLIFTSLKRTTKMTAFTDRRKTARLRNLTLKSLSTASQHTKAVSSPDNTATASKIQ